MVPQPNNQFGTQHCACIILYAGDSELESDGTPRWGLMDWLGGYPGRFICEWGSEKQVGPWELQTQKLMEPFLHTYFTTYHAGDRDGEHTRRNLEKQTKKARARLAKSASAERQSLADALNKSWARDRDFWSLTQATLVQRMLWLIQAGLCFPEPQEQKAISPQPCCFRGCRRAAHLQPGSTSSGTSYPVQGVRK